MDVEALCILVRISPFHYSLFIEVVGSFDGACGTLGRDKVENLNIRTT
jgi:hypothetical protein